MGFRRFMREEIEKADRRYMEEGGEQDFQANIAPLLATESQPKRIRYRRFAAVFCPILAIVLVSVLCLTFWNYTEIFRDADQKERSINLGEVNQITSNIFVNGEFLAIKLYSNKNENLNIELDFKGEISYTINIVLSENFKYTPPIISGDKTETEYQGWPLIYSVQKAVEEAANKFQVRAELNTGAEKVYIEYEQTTTDEECDFLDFLAQTIIKK